MLLADAGCVQELYGVFLIITGRVMCAICVMCGRGWLQYVLLVYTLFALIITSMEAVLCVWHLSPRQISPWGR